VLQHVQTLEILKCHCHSVIHH